jgi:hypothetical protein
LPSYEREPRSIPNQPLTEWRSCYLHAKSRSRTAISVPEQVALTAPAPPVKTASTKQEHNHDDNHNRFQTHIEVLRELTYRVGASLDETLNKPPLCTPLLGVAPDLLNPKPLKSLTGRGLASLFKKEHTGTLPPGAPPHMSRA